MRKLLFVLLFFNLGFCEIIGFSKDTVFVGFESDSTNSLIIKSLISDSLVVKNITYSNITNDDQLSWLEVWTNYPDSEPVWVENIYNYGFSITDSFVLSGYDSMVVLIDPIYSGLSSDLNITKDTTVKQLTDSTFLLRLIVWTDKGNDTLPIILDTTVEKNPSIKTDNLSPGKKFGMFSVKNKKLVLPNIEDIDRVTIFNSAGREVKSVLLKNSREVLLTNLPEGNYFVLLSNRLGRTVGLGRFLLLK